MVNKMKILYFDTETTGLDPTNHEIIQFAALIEIDGEIKEEVNWHCQPKNWEIIEKKSLEINGISLEMLKTFDLPETTASNIKNLFDKYIDKYDKTDKFYPAGHNISFDINFLQAFWKKYIDEYGTGSYQNWRCLDSRIMANFLLVNNIIKSPDAKLINLCSELGIKIEAHDALSDIRATRILINKMRKMIRPVY